MFEKRMMNHLITNYYEEKKVTNFYIDKMTNEKLKEDISNDLKAIDDRVRIDIAKLETILNKIDYLKITNPDYYHDKNKLCFLIEIVLSISTIIILNIHNPLTRGNASFLYPILIVLLSLLNGKIINNYINEINEKNELFLSRLKELKMEFKNVYSDLDRLYAILEFNNHLFSEKEKILKK